LPVSRMVANTRQLRFASSTAVAWPIPVDVPVISTLGIGVPLAAVLDVAAKQ